MPVSTRKRGGAGGFLSFEEAIDSGHIDTTGYEALSLTLMTLSPHHVCYKSDTVP